MKQHEFTLVLTADPDDEQADRMYGRLKCGPGLQQRLVRRLELLEELIVIRVRADPEPDHYISIERANSSITDADSS
jgi:hypothetical protein